MKDRADNIENEQIVRVVEEQLSIDREIVETGKVNVHKDVHVERVNVNIPVFNETYDIERRPGSEDILEKAPSAIRYEGDKIIIPVLREITVVQKKYQVIEEIHLTRKVTETPLVQEVELRKEEVRIDRKQNF